MSPARAALQSPRTDTTRSSSGRDAARRSLWRCRRGFKELDVLLERFARRELPTASGEEQDLFARLLELPDPLLIDCLLGGAVAPEPRMAALIRRILATA